MQYLLTEAEYNNIRVDKEEFERRVKLATEEQLKAARERTGKVIEWFFKQFQAQLTDPFSHSHGGMNYHALKAFSDSLREANSLPKESCDKKASSVVE